MSSGVLIVFVVLALGTSKSQRKTAKPATSGKVEWKMLLGDWKLISAMRGGKPRTDQTGSLKIEKDKFTLKYTFDGQERSEIKAVKIDFSKSPMQIDFGSKSDHGIFKLEGKKLTLCFDLVSSERPKKFQSNEESQVQLLVFERAKKE